MHSPQPDPAALRGEPTTRIDIPVLTPRRRFVAVVRVALRRCGAVLRAALSGFRVAQVLDSPDAARLHGCGVLVLVRAFQVMSPIYVVGAAWLAALHRWRGARDLFVAWVLVLIAGHAVARHQPPAKVVSAAADSRASAASSTSRSTWCS
jgi:hypothetical protein